MHWLRILMILYDVKNSKINFAQLFLFQFKIKIKSFWTKKLSWLRMLIILLDIKALDNFENHFKGLHEFWNLIIFHIIL